MKTKVQRSIRTGLADAYTFVRSQEVNKAIASVTFASLLQEQLARNGDTKRSNSSQFDPYTFDPDAAEPATAKPLARANFLGGTDTNNPTKLDRVLALQNSIDAIVSQMKSMPVEDIVAGDDLENPADADLLTTDPLFFGEDEG